MATASVNSLDRICTVETGSCVPEAPVLGSPRKDSFAVIVLAAGRPASRRHTNPFSPYTGRTLVEHATRTALASGATEVVVVAGADAADIARRLRKFRVKVIRNANFDGGIASSIQTGLRHVSDRPQAVVLTLCDQPKVTSNHLRDLVKRVLTPGAAPIVASAYEGVAGAPSAFARSTFQSLLALRGEAGARNLIREADANIETIQFDDANHEIRQFVRARLVVPFTRSIRTLRISNGRVEARAPPVGV